MEQNLSKKTRTESDLIGSREVPKSALYGVQTLRGIENFRISKFHLNEYPLFIQALAITKMGAAVANRELDLLTEEQADAILKACKEILEGKHHDQFPVDMIQGGAGTTTNMNANEVIANRALELMGHQRGEYQYCSPNDLIVIPEEEGEINVAWFMYEFIALSIPMKHVHAPGKCNKAMTSKLSKHLKTNANEDSDEVFDTGGDDIVIEEEVEEQIDPRWNELKKILDNN